MFDGLKENKLQIDKGANEYTGYIIGENNACAIHYLPNARVAYIHNMPKEVGDMYRYSEMSNVPIVEEKIFLVVETVNGEYCDDETKHRGKNRKVGYGVPLKGEYAVTSWFVTENGEQFGDYVLIGLLELEVDDQTGENYKKVIEYLAGYAAFHDFWVIYEEHEEALEVYLQTKEYGGE